MHFLADNFQNSVRRIAADPFKVWTKPFRFYFDNEYSRRA